MTGSRTNAAAEVEVIAASPEHEPVLANLLELYSHDFSEFIELTLGPDGRFGYKHLQRYWEEPGRHPFLIVADKHLAGFVFVHKGSEVSGDADVWDMAEFFVARGFRRHGVGTAVAREVWRKFPGRWEVRVLDGNLKAREFWRHAINQFLGEAVEPIPLARDGQVWHLFSFESKPAA